MKQLLTVICLSDSPNFFFLFFFFFPSFFFFFFAAVMTSEIKVSVARLALLFVANHECDKPHELGRLDTANECR